MGFRAAAHGSLAACIQHRAQVTLDAHNLDVTLDLTFFEEPSGRERAIMDTNTDGRVSGVEVEAYLRKLAPTFAAGIGLSVGGRTIPLVPLYEPELELETATVSVPAHHRLRLVYFASTPPDLKPGDRIEIEDRLWAEVKAVVSQQVESRAGGQLLAEPQEAPSVRGANRSSPVRFTFRCVRPPGQAATPNADRSSPFHPPRQP